MNFDPEYHYRVFFFFLPLHKYFPCLAVAKCNVQPTTTLKDLKTQVQAANKKWSVHRQSFRLEVKGKALKDSDSIETLNLRSGSKLYVKDLGPQIGWGTGKKKIDEFSFLLNFLKFQFSLPNTPDHSLSTLPSTRDRGSFMEMQQQPRSAQPRSKLNFNRKRTKKFTRHSPFSVSPRLVGRSTTRRDFSKPSSSIAFRMQQCH